MPLDHCPETAARNRYLDALSREQDHDDRVADLADEIIDSGELRVRLQPTTEKGRRMWMVDVLNERNYTVDDLAEWFDTIALAADAGERLLEKCAEDEARRRLDD